VLGVRCGRVAIFSSVVLFVVLLLGAGRARGDAGEKMIALGRELMPLADLLHGAEHATVNGESIYLASTVTEQPLTEVLDRVEGHCREHAGNLEGDYAKIPAATRAILASRVPAAWSERLGIVREERDGEGMVVCLAQNEEGGIRGLIEHIHAFLKDGELSHVGNFRYAYAQKTSGGKTHVLSTFTEGPFNVYRIVGGEKEPPRDELDGAPLPPNAETPMTFRVAGMPYAVQAFASADPAEKVAAYYLDALPRLGWEKVSGPGDLFSNVMMRRQGVLLLVTALQVEEGQKTHVVVTEGVATIPNVPR
jgi:hypothetical protein